MKDWLEKNGITYLLSVVAAGAYFFIAFAVVSMSKRLDFLMAPLMLIGGILQLMLFTVPTGLETMGFAAVFYVFMGGAFLILVLLMPALFITAFNRSRRAGMILSGLFLAACAAAYFLKKHL